MDHSSFIHSAAGENSLGGLHVMVLTKRAAESMQMRWTRPFKTWISFAPAGSQGTELLGLGIFLRSLQSVFHGVYSV